MFEERAKTTMVDAQGAITGRPAPLPGIPEKHAVLGTSMHNFPVGTEVLYLAFGCFWGAERIMWRLPGVVATAAGYMGGYTPNPTYTEVCTGCTGHTETVMVAYDPAATSPEQLLKTFWEHHDPTQGMRQGNDIGTQYRSAIYWTTPGQEAAARATYDAFTAVLRAAGAPRPITTELLPAGGDRRQDGGVAGPFYFAEDYHQQYLEKNPSGYCLHGPTGLTLPTPGDTAAADASPV